MTAPTITSLEIEMKLQIEEGGYYLNREGKVRGPMERNGSNPAWRWRDGPRPYREDGSFSPKLGEPNLFDLIERVNADGTPWVGEVAKASENPAAALLRAAATIVDQRDGVRSTENFERVASAWSDRTQHKVTKADFCAMMGDLKDARISTNTQWDEDSAIDRLGYMAWELVMRKEASE